MIILNSFMYYQSYSPGLTIFTERLAGALAQIGRQVPFLLHALTLLYQGLKSIMESRHPSRSIDAD